MRRHGLASAFDHHGFAGAVSRHKVGAARGEVLRDLVGEVDVGGVPSGYG